MGGDTQPAVVDLVRHSPRDVSTDAGQVQGYNATNAPTTGTGGVGQTGEAVAFNTADRSKTDNNLEPDRNRPLHTRRTKDH